MRLAISPTLQRHWKPLSLFLEVVLMAFLYQAIWIARPDYFRVENEVNDLPLDLNVAARSYSLSSGRPLPQFANPDIDAAVAKIRRVYAELQKLTAVIDSEGKTVRARRAADQAQYKSFEASQWRQANAYRQTLVGPISAKIASLVDRQRAILKRHGAKANEELPAGADAIEHANLSLEIAKLRVTSIEVDIAASDYILKNLPEFQKLPEQRSYLARRSETDALEKKLMEHELSIYDLNSRMYEAFEAYIRASNAKLGYADFLYFSIGGATTATFGDISPNHTAVRMLFSLQIIVSMVLVALWINDLTAARSRKHPAPRGER